MKKVTISMVEYMRQEAMYVNDEASFQIEKQAVKDGGPKNPWGLVDPETDEVIRVPRTGFKMKDPKTGEEVEFALVGFGWRNLREGERVQLTSKQKWAMQNRERMARMPAEPPRPQEPVIQTRPLTQEELEERGLV